LLAILNAPPNVGTAIALSNRRLGIDGRPGRALAAFACHPERSRGRRHFEPDAPLRSAFQRDRDRIVHSTAFRRLEHKTQVFVSHEGDHFRSRLTHTLEVAQIARTAARALGLEEDLAEAVALAHDLGHSPFGHAGEDALDAALAAYGGFDHNAQTLRVITRLERRYAEFDGLNLTWETLEGVVKHNGPLRRRVPRFVAEYCAEHDLELDTHPSAEAQIAALADDIAYCSHDLDDGLRAALFAVDDLAGLPLVGVVFADVAARYPAADQARLVNESLRRLIGRMVIDMVEETARRLAALKPADVAAVRAHEQPVVGFSPAVGEPLQQLRTFLHSRMYCHYKVRRMQRIARQVVRELFDVLLEQPDCLPPDWQARAGASGDAQTAEAIADYIAGMTDRFALDEHDRLFKLSGGAR
jgi:dGTPase